jgi:signal peptidase
VTSRTSKRNPLGGYFAALGAVLLVAMLVLAVASAAVPLLAGGHSWTMKNASMAPAVNTGDLVITKAVRDPAVIKVGQIIVLPDNGDRSAPQVRRVVGEEQPGDGRRLITKGDANPRRDRATVAEEEVMGVYMYRIPKLGYAIGWAERNGMAAIIALSVLVVLLTIGIFVLAARQRRLLQEHPAPRERDGGPAEGHARQGRVPGQGGASPSGPEPGSRGRPPGAAGIPGGSGSPAPPRQVQRSPVTGRRPALPGGPGRRSAAQKATAPWAPGDLDRDRTFGGSRTQDAGPAGQPQEPAARQPQEPLAGHPQEPPPGAPSHVAKHAATGASDGMRGDAPGVTGRSEPESYEPPTGPTRRPKPIPWLSGPGAGEPEGGSDAGRPSRQQPPPAERVISTRPDTVARPVAFVPQGPGVQGLSTGELPARRPKRIGNVESVADRLPRSQIPPGGAPRPWGEPEPEPHVAAPAPAKRAAGSLGDRIPRAQTPPWPLAPRPDPVQLAQEDDLAWMDDLDSSQLRPWDAPG